jgi:hypothetical protein
MYTKIIVVCADQDWLDILKLSDLYGKGNVYVISSFRKKNDWKKNVSNLLRKEKTITYSNTCILFAPCHTSVLGDFKFGSCAGGNIYDVMLFFCNGQRHHFTRLHLQSCYTGMILVNKKNFDFYGGEEHMVKNERENLHVRKLLSTMQKKVYDWLENMKGKGHKFTISGYVSTLLNSETFRLSDWFASKCIGMPVTNSYATKGRRGCFTYVYVGNYKMYARSFFNTAFQDSSVDPPALSLVQEKRKRNKEERKKNPGPLRKSRRIVSL